MKGDGTMPDGTGLPQHSTQTGALDLAGALVAIAERQPGAEALLAPGRPALTYGDVLDQLVSVRDTLNGWGLGRGDRVAVVLPTGPEAAVAFLAIAACATFVPLNADYTLAEFRDYLARLKPHALVLAADDDTPARAAALDLGIGIIDLITAPGAPAGQFTLAGGENRACQQPGFADPDDFAVILLSSGSTAAPKVVPIRHRHWVTSAGLRIQRLSLTAEDRAMNTMPLVHSHALFSLLAMILAGGAVLCLAQFEPATCLGSLKKNRITCFFAGFAILDALAAALAEQGGTARDTELRFLKGGAGALDARTISALERGFGVPLYQTYASTEAGVITSTALDRDKRRPDKAGLPVVEDIAILGDDGAFQPAGAIGEVIVRGPCVFDGYLDDPAANAAAFHNGWFRTGDLGSLDGDGFLTLAGRLTEMINRGGEKIAPQEIEAVLETHPSVAACAVFGIDHATLGQDVAAAIVLAPDGVADKEDLLRFANDRLAHFKVPREIYRLDDLPRTATGKLQRGRLLALVEQAEPLPSTKKDGRPQAATALEQAVAGVWRSVLGWNEIGLDENFLMLGGDSLTAASLSGEIEAVFGVEVPIRAIFDEAATIASMARFIDSARKTGAGTAS